MRLYLDSFEYVRKTYGYELDSNAIEKLNKCLSDYYSEDGKQAAITETLAADAYCGNWDTDSPLEKEYKRTGETYYFTLGDIVQSYLNDEVWNGELINEDVEDVYDTNYYVEEYN